MLRLVLDELAVRLAAEAQPLSESEKQNMVEFASELQELCAKSGVAPESSKSGTKTASTNLHLVDNGELGTFRPDEQHVAASLKESVPLNTTKNVMSLDEWWPPRVESVVDESCVGIATPAAIEAQTVEMSAVPPPDTSERNNMSVAHVETLESLFKALDVDKNGTLSADELRRGMIEAEMPVARLTKLFEKVDLNDNGEIEEEEWKRAIHACNSADLANLVETLSAMLATSKLFSERAHSTSYILNPTGKFRIAVDSTVFGICCYLGIMSPFVAAWEREISPATVSALEFVDTIIMIVFSFEIVLNFFTGYFDSNENLVDRHIAIARNYLSSWFLLDFITTFPFHLIGLNTGANVQTFKVLKLVKILKILKLMAPGQVDWSQYSDTMDSLTSSKAPQMLLKRSFLLIKLSVVVHWMACGMKVCDVKDTGFLSSYANSPEDISKEYLAGLYWAMTTLTTVGYGDICPTSDGERLYSILAMVIGGGFYGYVVGSICAMIANSDLNATAFYDRMELIQAWVRHHRLPVVMKRRIRRHFKMFLASKAAITDAEVWHELTPEMQREVGQYIIQLHVIANPIFDGLKTGTVVRLQTILLPVSAPRGRIIAEQGEAGTAMYILLSGCVQLTGTGAANEKLKKLGAAQSFGEEIVLGLAENYEYTARTLEETKMDMITEDDFVGLFTNMPLVVERMRQNAVELHPQWAHKSSPT